MISASVSPPTLATRIIPIQLVGRLDEHQLTPKLEMLSEHLRRGPANVVIDCKRMTDYTAEARRCFVAWIAQHRGLLQRVAIVVEQPLWHMVIRAMSFASGQPLQSFDTRDEADAWLKQG